MKIGIITFWKLGNFGADLQAYALQKKLQTLGFEVENIDYLYYKSPRFIATRLSRPTHPVALTDKIKAFLFPLLSSVLQIFSLKGNRSRKKKFSAFENNIIASREYCSVDQLYAEPPKYDVYMCGSDQIWNPRINTNIGPYFMDFAPKGSRVISYASSLGVDELPPSVFVAFRKYLSRFSAIGVREDAGRRIVGNMRLPVPVRQVLDPTLLLSAREWEVVSCMPDNVPVGKYLLVYDLIPSCELWTLAERWADVLKLKIVRICRRCGLKSKPGVQNMDVVGPGEFVWLFSHAEAIVTTSFHGVVFSIIHQKPFYFTIPGKMRNASRIESLCKVLGLQNRIVAAKDVESVHLEDTIDYTKCHERLEAEKQKSVEFLVHSVRGELGVISRKEIGDIPRKVYALWSKDKKTRAESTSGGFFSVLAESVIRNGGVVFGASWAPDFLSVRHVKVDKLEDLALIRKSKYVESDSRAAIEQCSELLIAGRTVLFSGTPCQVAAVQKRAGEHRQNLVTCDFVCHGTPRADVFASYIDELEKQEKASVTRYEFRNKDKGWNNWRILYSLSNGRTKTMPPQNDPFYLGFLKGVFLRTPCYTCPFSTIHRISDFTLGDCWRVAASHPQYDDNGGTSLVFVNTEKAEGLLQTFIARGAVSGGEYDLQTAERQNIALLYPATRAREYAQFKTIFESSRSFGTAAACYYSSKNNLRNWVRYSIKRFGWWYFKHRQ